MAGGAGGIGRPGANIAAGMPQGQAMAQQQGAPMPTTQPAISPMQQYMQSIGITRSAFNPMAQGQGSYAAPRPVPQFQPAINPIMQRASGNSASDPAKPTDYQRMRDELDQLRDWQARYTGNQNNGGGGGGN